MPRLNAVSGCVCVCVWGRVPNDKSLGMDRLSNVGLLPRVVGAIVHGGSEQNRRQRKEEFAPFCFLPACLSWDILSHLFHSLPWYLNRQMPGSQPFGLSLNYTTGFPGLPACG